jgi:hypothetical protein
MNWPDHSLPPPFGVRRSINPPRAANPLPRPRERYDIRDFLVTVAKCTRLCYYGVNLWEHKGAARFGSGRIRNRLGRTAGPKARGRRRTNSSRIRCCPRPNGPTFSRTDLASCRRTHTGHEDTACRERGRSAELLAEPIYSKKWGKSVGASTLFYRASVAASGGRLQQRRG